MNGFPFRLPLPRRPLVALAKPLCLLLFATMIVACARAPAADASSSRTDATRFAAVARGRVVVEGGLLSLHLPVDATLADVLVHEGDRVRAGQVLARADATAATAQVAVAQAHWQQARAQLPLLDARLHAARVRAQRLAQAATAGAGDQQAADDADEAVQQLAAERVAAGAAQHVAQAELDQARYLLGLDTLRAPVNAEVVSVAAQPGMSVSAASPPLFVLLPERPKQVRAEINETFVDAVHVGMSAQITDDDGQVVYGTAKVLRLGSVYGPTTLRGDSNSDAPIDERSIDCVLGADPPLPVKVGQRVLVRFLAQAPPPGPTDTKGN